VVNFTTNLKKQTIMKKQIPWLKYSSNSNRWFLLRFIPALLGIALLVSTTLITGCTSTDAQAAQQNQQKEAVLQQCGFKAVPVTTPQQLQQIRTLPPGKLSVVQRNAARYYVFPDPPRQMLYVGHAEQYLLYQNYLSNQAENAQYNAISKADPSVAKYNNEAEILSRTESVTGWDDATWGSWDAK
jgi:hypothetical protein